MLSNISILLFLASIYISLSILSCLWLRNFNIFLVVTTIPVIPTISPLTLFLYIHCITARLFVFLIMAYFIVYLYPLSNHPFFYIYFLVTLPLTKIFINSCSQFVISCIINFIFSTGFLINFSFFSYKLLFMLYLSKNKGNLLIIFKII